MWFWRHQSRRVRAALRNKTLHQALERASNQHRQKINALERTFPIEALKAKAKAIKDECLANLPYLIKQFIERATDAGAKVHLATNSEEALAHVEEILKNHQAKLVIKAKSMVTEEIGLNKFLESHGVKVVETDLGEWLVQLAGERPSHITAPALHKTKEEISRLLSQHLRRIIPPEAAAITAAARDFMRPFFFEAHVGITGANLAIAESGTLVILSNEGNARLVSSLPPVHIAIVTVEKMVATMEQAITLVKALAAAASGRLVTSYISFITGPSSTTDIEKEHVIGAHGPRELHIILLDNGRMALAKDKEYQEILRCLKCGGCMLVCPVFQQLGGHVFGGPVYPGGIGLLLTFMTTPWPKLKPLLSLCADCKQCESFCPVGIHSGELIARLRMKYKPPWMDKIICHFMRDPKLQERMLPLLRNFQNLWADGDYLKRLPFAWSRGKRIPRFKLPPAPRKAGNFSLFSSSSKRKKIYLFEGCLGRWFFPELKTRTSLWLNRCGFEPVCPSDQVCCGAPNFHLGDKKGLRQLIKQNLASLAREKPTAILTFCPTGHHFLTKIYPREVAEAVQWASKVHDLFSFLQAFDLKPSFLTSFQNQTVYYHAPCHLLAAGKKIEDRVSLFNQAGLEVRAEKGSTTCCGFCGVFSFKHPEIAAEIWAKKKDRILASSCKIILTECPGCLWQLRSGLAQEDSGYQAFHVAEILEPFFFLGKEVLAEN